MTKKSFKLPWIVVLVVLTFAAILNASEADAQTIDQAWAAKLGQTVVADTTTTQPETQPRQVVIMVVEGEKKPIEAIEAKNATIDQMQKQMAHDDVEAELFESHEVLVATKGISPKVIERIAKIKGEKLVAVAKIDLDVTNANGKRKVAVINADRDAQVEELRHRGEQDRQDRENDRDIARDQSKGRNAWGRYDRGTSNDRLGADYWTAPVGGYTGGVEIVDGRGVRRRR